MRELILHIVSQTWLKPGNESHERLLRLLADLIVDANDVPLVLPLPVRSSAYLA